MSLMCLISCSKDEEMLQKIDLQNEWKLYLNCPHTASCIRTKKFRVKREKNYIKFDTDSTFHGQILEIDFKGFYEYSVTEERPESVFADFNVSNFVILNTGKLSDTDSLLVKSIQNAESIHLTQDDLILIDNISSSHFKLNR